MAALVGYGRPEFRHGRTLAIHPPMTPPVGALLHALATHAAALAAVRSSPIPFSRPCVCTQPAPASPQAHLLGYGAFVCCGEGNDVSPSYFEPPSAVSGGRELMTSTVRTDTVTTFWSRSRM